MRSISKPISRIIHRADEPSLVKRLGTVHWGSLAAALALALVGVFTVNSATSELGSGFVARQSAWIFLGLVICALALAFDYRKLIDLAPIFYTVGLVVLVLILFFGKERGGARSWISSGTVGGQPTELVKVATALLLARLLARVYRPQLQLREILAACFVVALPVTLVALQRDMGSASMFLPMLAGMVVVAGVRWKHVLVMGLLGLVLVAGLWQFALHDFQKARVMSYLSPDADPLGDGYQVRQSKIAVGSGMWTGRGYLQGTQSQLRFLPARHTDFVMAVLAEEQGFFGVLLVLGLYGVFLSGAAAIAARSRDRGGVLLVTGLVSVIAFHVLYNTGMVIGFVPITGIPLPFLSYGGSFMLANFLAVGLILNVDYRRYVNR
ncbi:MAG: rod shape-determining protein RodA [Thermoanaerobaculia bacterium]|nr:rod shape-determining protein RodA [Thermoanaerobaculia bacterium]